MTDEVLHALLEGNREHVESLAEDYFSDVQDAQHPEVVSICCSDSRVSQEGMFHVDRPGWLFTPSNIGNQTWDTRDGERVVDGNLLYPLAHTDTGTVAVVGHTGCGAVTAAYTAVTGDLGDEAAGIQKYVDLLEPVVRDGLDGPVDADASREDVINQLVEYNVDQQVAYLQAAEEIPDGVSVYGFVYDFQRVYGDVAGRTYLVNRNGETDPAAIGADLPAEYEPHVRRLVE